ncbi:MAG: protein kinase, partial [Planctomycetes bacterium]|nr:protein kinase [Planctomycetota bacterium]
MEHDPLPPGTSSEDVFVDFVHRLESGQVIDFERVCADHPTLAPDLRRFHLRWLAMTRAFTAMSVDTVDGDLAADSIPFAALMQRLGTESSRIDRYRIGAEIARGAMGRVVLAWDEALRREVALKVDRGPNEPGRQQRRFLEEAQIIAQLDHPGIVPIYELGLDGEGRPFFSMPLVRGQDLGRILDLAATGSEGWSRTRVLDVLVRVCEAMAYA